MIGKAPLNHALTDGNRFDMALLSALPCVPFVRNHAFVLAHHQLTVGLGDAHRGSKGVPLSGTFPPYIPSTFAVGGPEIGKGENTLEVVSSGVEAVPLLKAPLPPSPEPRFTPFFTCHSLSPPTMGIRQPRTAFLDGYTSCVRPPGMKRRVHHQPPPCKQRPPGSIKGYIYPFGMVMFSLSPLALCSLSLLSLAWRGADADRVPIGSVVVVAVAVVVDVTRGRGRTGIGTVPGWDKNTTANHHGLSCST